MAKSDIVKGAAISYISIFLNIVISFVYTPWMIKSIGISDYGLYSLASSFIGYFILDFGMSSSIARFVAKYRAEGREDKVENMLGLTTKIYLAIDALIFIVLFVLFFFISGIFTGLTPNEIERFKKLYCIAGCFSVCSFVFKPVNGAMMAYEYFVENKLLDMVTRVGTVILVMIALLLGGNVFFLVLINGVVGLSVSITKYLILIKKSKLKINWRFFEKEELKVLFSFSMWIFLAGLAQRFRFTLCQSILGITSNSTQISLFSMGMMLEGMVYTIAAALNGLFLPTVTRMSTSGDKESVVNLMIRVGRIQLYVISLIFFGFCVFGRQFINLWVGQDFKDVYWILMLFIVSNLVSLTQSIANDYVYAENRVRTTSVYVFVCSGVGIIVAILLSRRYGALGCAMGTCFALLLNLLLVNLFYKNQLKLQIGRFFRECHLKILPLTIVLSVIAMVVTHYIQINSWISLIIGVGIYVVLYSTLAWSFLLNQSEKDLVKSFIKR